MKRACEEGSNEPTKHIRIHGPTATSKSVFVDDILYEIFDWLPSSFVLCRLSLVNNQWRKVIHGRSKLKMSLNEVQWADYPKEPSTIFTVTELSLSNRYGCIDMDLSRLSTLKSLERICFHGFVVKENAIETLLENGVNNFEFRNCSLLWSDLVPLANSPLVPSVYLDECSLWIDKDNIDTCVDIISKMKNLKSFTVDMDNEETEENTEIQRKLYESIPSLDNISEISMSFNDVSLKYLPRMKNLNKIQVQEMRSVNTPINLSNLTRLEHLSSWDDTIIWKRGVITTPMRSTVLNALSGHWLNPVVDNLKSLSVSMNELSRREWERILTAGKLSGLTLFNRNIRTLKGFSSVCLTRLVLHGSVVESGVLQAIRKMKSLVHLDLSECKKGKFNSSNHYDNSYENEGTLTFDDICYNLDDSPKCDLIHLRELYIAPSPEGSRAMSVLADMENMTIIHLSRCKALHLDYIAKSDSLRELCIDTSALEGIEHLSCMKHLKKLVIRGCELKSHHINSISFMAGLRELDVSLASIDKHALKAIATVSQISCLSLSVSNIRLKHFDIFSSMSHLRVLCIDHECRRGLLKEKIDCLGSLINFVSL